MCRIGGKSASSCRLRRATFSSFAEGADLLRDWSKAPAGGKVYTHLYAVPAPEPVILPLSDVFTSVSPSDCSATFSKLSYWNFVTYHLFGCPIRLDTHWRGNWTPIGGGTHGFGHCTNVPNNASAWIVRAGRCPEEKPTRTGVPSLH
jgi:hypothetical protein